MVSDEEVMLLFKKYLHFNSQEEAEEFTSTFLVGSESMVVT